MIVIVRFLASLSSSLPGVVVFISALSHIWFSLCSEIGSCAATKGKYSSACAHFCRQWQAYRPGFPALVSGESRPARKRERFVERRRASGAFSRKLGPPHPFRSFVSGAVGQDGLRSNGSRDGPGRSRAGRSSAGAAGKANFLDGRSDVLYMFPIRLLSLGPTSRAARERPLLFEKGKRLARPQPGREAGKRGRNFFTPNARNPLKSPDLEK